MGRRQIAILAVALLLATGLAGRPARRDGDGQSPLFPSGYGLTYQHRRVDPSQVRLPI